MSEYRTDQATNPIPSMDTWELLSVNQLIDVKARLQERLWQFRNNQQMVPALKRAIATAEHLISERSSV